jgi:hypothetical protein
MTNVYIARKYVAYETGRRRYYEEGVFSSYESAHDFIRMLSVEDEDSFLGEIVRYGIDDTSPWDDERVWTFDRKAELVHSSASGEETEHSEIADSVSSEFICGEPEPKTYTRKFAVGDIVLIRAFPWNAVSPTSENVIGVITNTPVSFDDWVSQGGDKHDWGNTYEVYRVLRGYLEHIHVVEEGIEFYNDPLPDNLIFLKDLSEQVRGIPVLKTETMSKVLAGEVFVERVRHLEPDDYVRGMRDSH